ncbi:MAG: bifunctional adenosylcobinamide kinase/adenosylcobinamide-phosphate guanylyltransferase [Acidobacteria bacterium]|nr:MAG: bifunctional adenosylcobinamide kinase/adenosylcobinamide-phosphate guanylyltransferase [Acidobacteriota bacterium]
MKENSSKKITLVLGGVRSGKSHYAQNLVTNGGRVAFIATAEALDEEMRQRIARHREERPAGWTTLEAPLALEDAILECSGKFDIIVVDCLTLWTSNLMGAEDSQDERIFARADRLCESLRQVTSSVVLVSNEVGCGIVPDNDAARLYRDLLGGVNQRVAAIADKVLLLVAGYPMTVKDVAGATS